MPWKIAIVAATFALVGAVVFGAVAAANPSVGLPRSIDASSACPVAGCASGACHGYAEVPSPDGVHEMRCPEAGCASVECHAWDTLETRYYRPSDASLNLWIVAPAALVVGLVMLVRKL